MKKLTKKMMLMFTMMMLSLMMVVPAHAASMQISRKNATISVGGKVQLKVKGTKKKAIWKSSNKAVATVSKGLVRGKAAGAATITAKVGKKTFTCRVTVKGSSKASGNVWEYRGNVYNVFDWTSIAFCNQRQAQNMVRSRPVYLKYNANGDLEAKIAVNNTTPGRNYYLTDMYIKITLPDGSVVAEGTFSWNNYLVYPMSVGIVKVRFDKGYTKQRIVLSRNWAISIATN